MNKNRREEIERATEALREILAILEQCRDEEQEYFDNMPENLQGSDRGQAAEQSASCLDDACSSLDEVIQSCESSVE